MTKQEKDLKIQALENRVRWHHEQADLAEEEIRGIEALAEEKPPECCSSCDFADTVEGDTCLMFSDRKNCTGPRKGMVLKGEGDAKRAKYADREISGQ